MNEINETQNGLIIDKLVNFDKYSNEKSDKRECNGCHSTDIEIEEGFIVCTKCGQIYDNQNNTNNFRNDPTQEYTQNCNEFTPKLTNNLTNNMRYNNCGNRMPMGKKYGLKWVQNLSSMFKLGTHLTNETITKYNEISNHLIFNYTSKQTKKILAANCVYITLLNDNKPVTIGHICNAINITNSDFGKVYSQLTEHFPQYKPEWIPIERLVSVTLSEANFDKEEIIQLEERVIQILEIQRECCLIEGRTPFHLIFGATFIAWKSLKPYVRRKTTLKKFCEIINIEFKHTTSQRVTELMKTLTLLYSKFNANKEQKLTNNNISLHIKDILQYRNSLIYDLNLELKQSKKDNTDDQNPNNKSIDWINTFKRKAPQNCDRNSISANYLTKDNLNLSEKSDEEISDSEIDGYIRKPKELKFIKKLKTIVNKNNEGEEDVNKNY